MQERIELHDVKDDIEKCFKEIHKCQKKANKIKNIPSIFSAGDLNANQFPGMVDNDLGLIDIASAGTIPVQQSELNTRKGIFDQIVPQFIVRK